MFTVCIVTETGKYFLLEKEKNLIDFQRKLLK